jgi:hypothetical protein
MSIATAIPAFPRAFAEKDLKNPAMERMEAMVKQAVKRNGELERTVERLRSDLTARSSNPIPAPARVNREISKPVAVERPARRMSLVDEIFD